MRTPPPGFQYGQHGLEPETCDVWIENVKRETDKAFLVEIDGKEYWLPKSQVFTPLTGASYAVEAEISLWIAKQAGIDV